MASPLRSGSPVYFDGIAGREKGSTLNDLTIYIDPRVPRWMYPGLVVHEWSEMGFEQSGDKYPASHEKATAIEKEFVGKRWKTYDGTYKAIMRQIYAGPKGKDPADMYYGHTKGPIHDVNPPKWNDAQVERLVKIYSSAELKIEKQIEKALLKGNKTQYLENLRNTVATIRDNLLSDSREWTDTTLSEIYTKAVDDVDGALGGLSFGEAHQNAMQLLADNTYSRFEEVDAVIGRRVDDIYRSVQLENIQGAIVGSETWKQAAQNIREDLADQGITGFKDSAGRNWDMTTYSEMVARTATAEVQRESTKTRILEHGGKLAQISSNESEKTCDACAEWAGQIVSLTGSEYKGYPPYEDAEDDGVGHPNCTHRLSAAVNAEAEEEGD